MLAQQVWASRAKRVAKGQGRDQDVIELTDNGDEIGYEVDRNRQIGDQRKQDELAAPWDPVIADQAAEQHEAVRDEARERPGLCVAAREKENGDEGEIREQRDTSSDEQPCEYGHGSHHQPPVSRGARCRA